MILHTIKTKKQYEDPKTGEMKNRWNDVGTIKQFESEDAKGEGLVVELNMFPTTKFHVFKIEKKEK